MSALVLILPALFAGTQAFGAQAAAHKPLPETAVLDRVDGRLLHADANEVARTPPLACGSAETWLFELTAAVQTPSYSLPTGTRFTLLPSATLGQLIADVNERVAPRYRLSARVTQYRGRNYLLPTYYLPLSRFKNDTSPQDAGANPQSAIRNPQSLDPNLAIPPEVLEQLKNQPPLRAPGRDSQTRAQPAPRAADRVLVNCVGRIESRPLPVPGARPPAANRQPSPADVWVFVPYGLGWNVSDLCYALLPSRALEEALQVRQQALDPIRFNVAGLVTEFKDRQYLLLQRTIVVYNYGDFGR